jgi:hypothetical protein
MFLLTSRSYSSILREFLWHNWMMTRRVALHVDNTILISGIKIFQIIAIKLHNSVSNVEKSAVYWLACSQYLSDTLTNWATALTNWATECSCRALITSSCINSPTFWIHSIGKSLIDVLNTLLQRLSTRMKHIIRYSLILNKMHIGSI